MIRNTLLLAAASAALMAAPALAQDATGQTPPPAATPSTAPAPASGMLQLQPGANVKSSDGSVLGTLEGVRNNDAGEQELTVRGTDGQLRGVPLGGLSQEGADVVVGWTSTEYQAAPAIAGAAAAPVSSPAAAPPASDPGTTPPPAPESDPEAEPEAEPADPQA
jgi:opacity protein-like surface antigen